ncbi:MAG: hypothetical protein GWO82_04565 [Bacteroidetes bacterium]|nr:hypothetical protein [Bacteroidota bacterium]
MAGDIVGTTGIVGGIRTRIGTGIPIGMFIAMHLFTTGLMVDVAVAVYQGPHLESQTLMAFQ